MPPSPTCGTSTIPVSYTHLILRAAVKEGTEMGLKAKSFMQMISACVPLPAPGAPNRIKMCIRDRVTDLHHLVLALADQIFHRVDPCALQAVEGTHAPVSYTHLEYIM